MELYFYLNSQTENILFIFSLAFCRFLIVSVCNKISFICHVLIQYSYFLTINNTSDVNDDKILIYKRFILGNYYLVNNSIYIIYISFRKSYKIEVYSYTFVSFSTKSQNVRRSALLYF